MSTVRHTKRHEVRDGLRRQIAAGAYRPGQKLRQTAIAREFGVALSVVREALIELHAHGLVEAIDNRGAAVREMTTAELLDSFELREVFEGCVARRCCSRITVRELRELRKLAAETYREYQQGSRVKAARHDQEFHARLVAIAASDSLERLAANHWTLGKVATVEGGDWEQAYDGHLRVLDAIESGNEDEAERVMRAQVRLAREQFERLLREPGVAVTWLGGPEALLNPVPRGEAETRPVERETGDRETDRREKSPPRRVAGRASALRRKPHPGRGETV